MALRNDQKASVAHRITPAISAPPECLTGFF